ncbi:uncharacterized protein HD556DRAFT_1314530 [Suillus plorans]|uniref:CxC2-like cysteine cluster KDZ transposase-associated domain-containing protein n=1 Tax=Suillus plorans TaxID=116603 RepID=A0A9P7ABM7_9AGAM|nr:uncharacterized protein HD556DRAFT_1314530 [Suillus plorans]KAG1785081.1 hypothetical protein HD556DRAFT_1314530 [Suillus plorans]
MRVSSQRLLTRSSPLSTSQLAPTVLLDDGAEFDSAAFDYPSMSMEDETLPPKRKRTAGDNPLLIWLGEHDTYLLEIIRLDGRGDNRGDVCAGGCGSDPGQFRCEDCDDMQLYCAMCTLRNHVRSPSHRIQEWNSMFFQVTSLKKLGLHIQLGHPIGQRCILPQQAFNDDFVLIDTNGIHEIALDFCGCETSQTHVKQLLRHRWFPATSTDPRTAATFRLLHHYQILSFESKASAYEFYHSLVRLTDNTGMTKRKDRYEAFMRMWHKRLWTRIKSFPQAYGLDHFIKTIRFFVPKFHLPAHVTKCQTLFSFNFMRFVGRTDGEAPERGWSNINPVASSTKAMGPGCRRDTLDDYFGDWNWKKTVGFGASLLLKMKDTLAEKAEHEMAFEEFDTVVTPDHRSTWLAEMEVWEGNPNNMSIPNPLEAKAMSITQAGACLKLAELEAEELHVLIASGIDLEEEQRRLSTTVESLGLHVTDTQKANIVRLRNSLYRKINTWRCAQVLYLPVVQDLINQAACNVQENAEYMKLWLPSQLRGKPCDTCLQNDEWELRYAQAYDALEEIRQCLRIHCSLLMFKREWICGQGSNTRAQNALARVHGRRTACVKQYRSAWVALNVLATVLKKKDWRGRLQELVDDDIKPLVDPFATGEGRRQVSWIWMMEGVNRGNDGDTDGVRIEWCKSRARALRWAEEVELLREEMRRVLQFLAWQAAWWDGQGNRRVRECAAETEGLKAYAARQANLRRRLGGHFCMLWAPHLSAQALDELTTLASINVSPELSLPDLTIPDIP